MTDTTNETSSDAVDNQVIRSMVDSILQGDSAKAKGTFDNLISARVSDALDNKKIELAQSIYSRD